MMVSDDLDFLATELEKQELESPNGIAAAQVYEELLAIYLYQNDLCNAKYLWKRIPQNIKSSSQELERIWVVAQYMWRKDYKNLYNALNVTWSDRISSIIKKVKDGIRNRVADLVSQAYTSISLETMCQMTGLEADICTQACLERGWKIETDTKMIHPVRNNIESNRQLSSEDQLYKLTNFVSFLEN